MTQHTQPSQEQFAVGSSFTPTTTVEADILPIALEHGMELWWNDSTPKKRLDTRDNSSQFTRYVNNRVSGKLAEVAFSQLLETYFDCNSAVDWRIYDGYTNTDDGDLQHLINTTTHERPSGGTRTTHEQYDLGVELEVKKTKPWNSWLAIRDEIYTRMADDAPIVLTKLHIDTDIQLDKWKDARDWDAVDTDGVFKERVVEFAAREFPLDVSFVGAVYKDEFTDYFNQGDYLYDPETGNTLGDGLKRDNYGIHVDDIPNNPARWNRVVSELTDNAPQDIWSPLCIVD